MENKFADDEIINCLNDTEGKEDIGIYCTDKNGNFATIVKLTDLVDLLNRQKAEIERLQEENKKQKLVLENINETIHPLPFVTDFDVAMNQAKSEAIKEFAERLKECRVIQTANMSGYIDNLAKEMEGEDGLN